MINKKIKNDKLLYPIGEVAKMFNVNTSLIRFWEKEFDIIKPKKNKKGNRFFTNDDIKNFNLIFHLVKEKGLTLKGAKLKLKNEKNSTLNNFKLVSKLQEIKNLLIEVKNIL